MKAICILIVLVMSAAVSAHEFKAGDITIGHPYAFVSIGKARTGAGFLTLRNGGDTADALIGISSDFAVRNEIHNHTMTNGRMMMRPVEKIDIPAGATINLEPGGLHLMLMGLKAPLKLGEKRPVTLYFEKSGEVTVDLSIEARKSGATGHGTKHN